MRDVTAHAEVRDGTTVLSLYGAVDAHRSGELREVLDLARRLRSRGPIVVDLAGVDELSSAHLRILRRAAAEAARAGRSLTVRGLRVANPPAREVGAAPRTGRSVASRRRR